MHRFSISDIKPGAAVHMIGIGGISMSGLSGMLLDAGYKVTGSDAKTSPIIDELIDKGAEIAIGQSADNIKSPDLVCYTAAIAQDNPELVRARELGVPVIERAELLGAVMELYRYPIAVAGTHGKTTTTSMLSLVLLAAETDPTILVGGELPEIGGNYRIGKKDYLPFEACEYVESFLHFRPFLSIITNVEEDHLDYFSDINHIISSFQKFASLTSPEGGIIVCYDDKNACKVVQNSQQKIMYYSYEDEKADYYAKNITISDEGYPKFDIMQGERKVLSLQMHVAGRHNILNALAVTAAGEFLKIDRRAIKRGLEMFKGTKRRFEKIGFYHGAALVDDYAHHPTEIKTTLASAKKMPYDRVVLAFQPHTYTRTKALLDYFAEVLPMADKVLIADIYAAREKYDGSIHACDLAAKIPGCVYINDLEAMTQYLKKELREGDLFISMGAGDICKVAYALRDAEDAEK